MLRGYGKRARGRILKHSRSHHAGARAFSDESKRSTVPTSYLYVGRNWMSASSHAW